MNNNQKPKTYIGVTFNEKHNLYKAHITLDGKNAFLGYYDTPEEAATAYNRNATKFFGEFACLNSLD